MDSATSYAIAQRALKIAGDGRPELAFRHLKVPMAYYQSEEIRRREADIFAVTPLAVVHRDQVANPFDFLVLRVCGKSLLVTRNGAGRCRVFLNTCQHRGAEPASGCGNRRHFSCPYHGWVYDSDGRLVSIPQRDRFADLDIASIGLIELPSEERHGFVWSVLTPGAAIDVARHLGALDSEIAAWHYSDHKFIGAPADVEIEANWKATGEGFLEGLHVPFVHRGTFDRYTDVDAASDLTGCDAIDKHVRLFYVNKPNLMGRLVPGREHCVNVREFANVVYWIFPNLTLANTPTAQGGTIYISYYPGDSTQHTRLRAGFLAPDPRDDATALAFQQGQAELAKRSIIEEDLPMLASCGRGFRNGHGHALIGRNEPGVQTMIRSLARSLDCALTEL